MSTTDQPTFDGQKVIARNAVLGALIAFGITVAVVLLAGEPIKVALAVACLPAAFAGPFVAGLMTVIAYHNSGLEDH